MVDLTNRKSKMSKLSPHIKIGIVFPSFVIISLMFFVAWFGYASVSFLASI